MMCRNFFSICICSTLAAAACVENAKEPPSSLSQTVKKAVDRNSVIVHFRQGKDTLSSLDRSRIEDLLVKERALGEIDKIEVAVWSDQDFPANGTDLPKNDRDLATHRGGEIRAFLKSKNTASIQTFNMAETASGLEKLFNTEQAEVRATFSKGGKADINRDDFVVIRNEGGPSKAVIYVFRKAPDMRAGEDSQNY